MKDVDPAEITNTCGSVHTHNSLFVQKNNAEFTKYTFLMNSIINFPKGIQSAILKCHSTILLTVKVKWENHKT